MSTIVAHHIIASYAKLARQLGGQRPCFIASLWSHRAIHDMRCEGVVYCRFAFRVRPPHVGEMHRHFLIPSQQWRGQNGSSWIGRIDVHIHLAPKPVTKGGCLVRGEGRIKDGEVDAHASDGSSILHASSSSLTASTETCRPALSASSSSISMTFSTPPAPIITGTPT